NIPTESNMADHMFGNLYSHVNREWEKKLGWPLFLSLSREDQYNLSHLRIPITDSQQEFDQQVLSLVKVLIDSLNEKKLRGKNGESAPKGIGKLQNWLECNSFKNYEEHIVFLRNLQELRSAGSGHRKGKSYSKISEKFGLTEKSTIDVFESVLLKANAFLEYLLVNIPKRAE
ncbi:hypothetical protein, partial [Arcanobacterium phocae]|uniref:hypothetical protein n=1 Tax=Arcanobacterium phocae TaxID=131112 RepID=UPI00209EE507